MTSAVVKAKAQPMVIDEQTELWKPLKSKHVDPMSMVTIIDGQYIVACRIADGQQVLKSEITSNLIYHKVNGLFHHWSIHAKSTTFRHGLTFINLANATRFKDSVLEIRDSLYRQEFDQSSCTSPPDEAPKRPEKPATLRYRVQPPPPPKPEHLLMALQAQHRPQKYKPPLQPPLHVDLGGDEDDVPHYPPPRLPTRHASVTLPIRSNLSGVSSGQGQGRVAVRQFGPKLPPRASSVSSSPSLTCSRPQRAPVDHHLLHQPHIHQPHIHQTVNPDEYADYRDDVFEVIHPPTRTTPTHSSVGNKAILTRDTLSVVSSESSKGSLDDSNSMQSRGERRARGGCLHSCMSRQGRSVSTRQLTDCERRKRAALRVLRCIVFPCIWCCPPHQSDSPTPQQLADISSREPP